MTAGFGDDAVCNGNDPVRIADGGKPVGNDDGGTPAHHRIQSLLHKHFRDGIQGTGGFVQNQDGRVFQDGYSTDR